MARKLTTALRVAVTQASNDAWSTVSIPTGLQVNENMGLLIKRVEFSLIPLNVAGWANADIAVNVGLLRGESTTTLYGSSSPRNIIDWFFAVTAQTSSVDAVIPCKFIWDAPANLVIADQSMVLAFQTYATAKMNTLSCVVYCERTVLTPGQVIQLRAW